MTGYENLEYELIKRFNKSKVASNQPFIHAIVEILADNQEDKIALEIAEQKTKEAEEKLKIAQQYHLRAENEMKNNQNALHLMQVERDNREKMLEQLEEVKNQIEKCETAEARDKLRLAEFFCNNCKRELDGVAFARGLSNILGNGGAKISNKYNSSDDDPVLGTV